MNKKEEVLETVKMFKAIDDFMKSSKDYKNAYISFRGYDANSADEYMFIQYVEEMLISGPFKIFLEELNDAFDFHASAPQRDKYLNMLKVWHDLTEKERLNLSSANVEKMATAGGLQFI